MRLSPTYLFFLIVIQGTTYILTTYQVVSSMYVIPISVAINSSLIFLGKPIPRNKDAGLPIRQIMLFLSWPTTVPNTAFAKFEMSLFVNMKAKFTPTR